MVYKRWGCPKCKQMSSRRWNMKVHIERAHGIGEPIERVKLAQERMYGSFGGSVTSTNSPSSTRAETNRTSSVGNFQVHAPYIAKAYP